MNTLIRIEFIVFVLLSFSSCVREIDIDEFDVEQQLVVNAFIQSGRIDSLFLSSTFSYVKTDYIDGNYINQLGVGGAMVLLINNDDTIGSFEEIGNGVYSYVGDDLEERQEYEIVVDHPDFKPISATTTIPAVPNIWFANHPEDNALYKLTTKNYLQVILDIQDDGSTNDYYIITASSIREFNFPDNPNVTHIYYWSNRLNSKSSLIEIVYSSPSYNYVQNNFDWESSAYSPSQKEIIFSDKLFNGQQISIPIDIADGRWWSHTTQIHLHVTVISEEYYQLLRSFAALSKTRDQLFSDGIQIYGNIKNGQGIWAAKSSKSISLDVSLDNS
ncbi:MAG: DUF4249 domain-containing protein [Prolixibacteraceae bacterium]|jgi:hypothetical protein|nr:DUF4249 domain-containing protein [Prolixibacteraceae bacterium]